MALATLTGGRVRALRDAKHLSAVPAGFDEFWTRTLSALFAIEPHPTSVSLPFRPAGSCVAAEFRSLGGATIRCWFSGPRNTKEPRAHAPLLVTCHGYGGAVDQERIRRLSGFGMNVVGVDVRGFGLSRDAIGGISPYGYVMTGHASAESSIMRGAVCDYIQAYRAATDWFGLANQVTFQGFSFAGGLAIMAASSLVLARECRVLHAPAVPNVVAAGAPTFGDLRRRLELCQSGSGKETATYLSLHPNDEKRTMNVLSHFDTCFFAPRLRLHPQGALKRLIMGVGLHDPVVPPETVFAIFNAFPQPAEIIELPCSHTERPEETEWVRWEGKWIRAASKGA